MTLKNSCRFIDSDDKDHTVKYIADEKGYRVVDGTPTYIKPVPAVVQPYQYIQYIRHHPSSYPVQYVPAGALPSPGFKYVYNGSKYVLQPLAGESSRRGSVHSFHPNVVYALVKWFDEVWCNIYCWYLLFEIFTELSDLAIKRFRCSWKYHFTWMNLHIQNYSFEK